ncbi:hypothetical protein D8824_00590 [Streptococcus intermedius]|uniref:hypothetical protein n=1 Tax=Streptococcus intermedius TaxID=1338 RepID=UPI000F66BDD8|nr:hypothetical protein [Streptococcus intermedius]RSJ11279.1 hypothetical protein D8833_00580 [Streptococcus intermedius]RSJ17398.1 hypothetical protein D8831_00590 [Streptococcus intermedius]RSJ32573.1 hypothetical protein D8824_00590 [Streptococcus intermedius]
MKKKVIVGIVSILVLVSGGIFYMTHSIPNSHDDVSNVLDEKGIQLYKHGFRLLEEQIATYIKEHYAGVSKIEFSPIFIQGDNKHSMFHANVVPVVYDESGNKAYLGRPIGTEDYARYGSFGDVLLSFDGSGKEVIELRIDNQYVDVSGSKHLPDKVRLTSSEKIDKNMAALIKDGQLKSVGEKDGGSPQVEITYNTEIKKGEHWKWR